MFKTTDFRNMFKQDIENIFADYYDEINTEIQVIYDNEQEMTFPCCYIEILNPISADRYNDGSDNYNYRDFSLSCELYSKDTDINRKDAVLNYADILINEILKKYTTFSVTQNQPLPYKTDVARRVVRFTGTVDTKNKRLYNN